MWQPPYTFLSIFEITFDFPLKRFWGDMGWPFDYPLEEFEEGSIKQPPDTPFKKLIKYSN